jgi:hypothetical protein
MGASAALDTDPEKLTAMFDVNVLALFGWFKDLLLLLPDPLSPAREVRS